MNVCASDSSSAQVSRECNPLYLRDGIEETPPRGLSKSEIISFQAAVYKRTGLLQIENVS